MNYRASRFRRNVGRSGGGRGKAFVVFALAVVLAAFGIYWFRQQASEVSQEASVDSGASVVTLNQTDEAPIRRNREETNLYNVDGVGLATASREVQDHVFHHTVVANLADLPEGMFYEGWLVRAEPFDFFSTGAMEKNADGTYALVWDGAIGKDYEAYDDVIITQETIGIPGPGLHVLEGEF